MRFLFFIKWYDLKSGQKGKRSILKSCPTVFNLLSPFCDAIDDCSLKAEIWKICVLSDSHIVEFDTWFKFFTGTVLKTYIMRTGSYLFCKTWKTATYVLKRWKCGLIQNYKQIALYYCLHFLFLVYCWLKLTKYVDRTREENWACVAK